MTSTTPLRDPFHWWNKKEDTSGATIVGPISTAMVAPSAVPTWKSRESGFQ